MSNKKVLLKGVKVLDFSRILVGSFASMMLADLGAEVIKVESMKGDETRQWGPPFIDNEYSTYFTSLNRNKKSIVIDLKNKYSKEVTSKLASKADIIIENFPANKLTKFELDYDSVRKINKKIIYASVNGFGYQGEMKETPAFDFIIQAYSGIMGVTGKDSPFRVGFPVCDILTSQQLYSAILAALLHKKINDEGQLIQTSLLESSIFANPTIVSAFLNGMKNSKLIGNDHPNISPYTVFFLKENSNNNIDNIAIGVALDSQFNSLIKVLNIQNNSNFDIKKYETNSLRVKNRVELNELLQNSIIKFVQQYGEEKLISEFNKFGIPFSKINSMEELFNQNQVKDLKIVQETSDYYDKYEDKSSIKIKYAKHPVNYEKIEISDFKRPPKLGEDTKSVLKNYGFSDEDIDRLTKLKAIL